MCRSGLVCGITHRQQYFSIVDRLPFLHQKPGDVVLRERRVAPVGKSVVDELQRRMAIKHLAGEVALEQPVVVPAVWDR